MEPEPSLLASPAIDFVAREEFDFTIAEVAEERPLASIDGISYRAPNGQAVHNPDREIVRTWTACRSWSRSTSGTCGPRTTTSATCGTRTYRCTPGGDAGPGARSASGRRPWAVTGTGPGAWQRASRSRARAQLFPQVKELFFDDDTFTDDRPRAEAIARGLGRSASPGPATPRPTCPGRRCRCWDNGLRLLLVGYESGNQQVLNNVKKGLRVDRARRFAADCRDLGITVHGTFILGLPGETRETIQETIRFAREVNPHTIQVSVAAPYPGTELYQRAKENGWLPEDDDGAALVSEQGTQLAALSYPHLGHTEILESVDAFYKRFYFRAGKLAEMSAEMLRQPGMAARRLREGGEFVRFLGRRGRAPAAQ